MKRAYKIYMFCVFGALGGLVGSFIHQHTLLEFLSHSLNRAERLKYLVILGGLVGASIGFFPSFSEGLENKSFIWAFRSGLVGAFWGALGGLLALPLAELLHKALGGGFKGRATALAIWGLFVGVATGINTGARLWQGMLGGVVGGVIAGICLELFLPHQATYADSGIIALLIIGLSIAASISCFVNVFAEAWLEALPGSAVSGIYLLSKFRDPSEAFLGSKRGAVFIWIPGAQPRQAAISLTPNGARLRHLSTKGETYVNGHQVKDHMLRNGEIIEIEGAKLRYRVRRRTQLFATQNAKVEAGPI